MKKSWWRSLQIKIIAWSFIPAVIILSAVAWFTFYSYQKVIGDLAIKQDREIVQEKGTQAVTAIGNAIAPIVLPIFLDIDVLRQEPLELRAEKILAYAQDAEIFDGGIYFLDQGGKVFKTYPEQPELIGQDWSGNPEFQYLLEHNNFTVPTDLRSIGASEEKSVCTVMAMIGQQMETVGAVYYCYRVVPASQNIFYQVFNNLDLGPDVVILDANQKIIFSPDLSEIGEDLSAEPYLQQLFQEEGQAGRFRIGSRDRFVSYVSVLNYPGYPGWIVLKQQDWSDLMQPSLAYRRFLYLLLALGVIVPVLVTAYGVRHIIDPIQKLIKASEQVTAGRFDQRIDVKTGDEIETLADQFNLMSSELAESYASLEKKVADRTRELAILNSIISVASHSLNFQEILEDVLQTTVEKTGFDAGLAFKLPQVAKQPAIGLQPTPPLLMAHRGFDPVMAVDLVHSYALSGQGTPAVFPGEVRAFGIEEFQDENLKSRLSQLDFHLLVYIPLSTKGRQLGFFILGKREAGQLSPEELSLFSSIGRQVGVAMENARLYEQAEQAAITAERSRLARELHDAVTQTLFSASLIADVLPRIWKRDPEEGMHNLEELRQLTRGALAEMRTLLLEMRPESLERADLKSLLTQLSDAFVGRVRIPLELDISGDCPLTHEVKVVFYRTAQEALNNIAKHSGARQVEMHLSCQPGRISLLIKDDGLGFDPGSIAPGHLGIAIMRERAGSIGADFKVESQPGQGTTIALDWGTKRRD